MQTNEPARSQADAPSRWMIALFGRHPEWTAARVVTLLVVTFVLWKFVAFPIRVRGHSMEPTYRDERINVVNRLAYVRHAPRRGDVVAIRLAGESVVLLKRIIGLPGEKLTIKDGVVRIDGEPLDEPYLHDHLPWEDARMLLDDDEYFVVGDNRRNSDFGTVTMDIIIGKVVF